MAALPEKSSKFCVSADELKDVLECPVCLKVPRHPPVYQCERGHCICQACHSKLTNCPVCRIPMGKTRSLIFEKVLQKMPRTCKFSDNGCAVEEVKSNLDSHEKECEFRMVNCVDLACSSQICISNVIEHMHNDHEREDFVHTANSTYRSHFIVQSSDFTREIMWISDHIELDSGHFFRECCRSRDGQWLVWVYMVGSQKECEDYIYTIKLVTDDKVARTSQDEELMYRGNCVPLDVSKEKLPAIGNCLMFPDATAKRFWNNQRINYQVFVVKRKQRKERSSNHSSSKEAAADQYKEADQESKSNSTDEKPSDTSSKKKSIGSKDPAASKDSGVNKDAGVTSSESPKKEEERETSC